jgi:adenine-specific DNA-methyltransferase
MKQYRNPNKDPRGPWRPIPLDAQAGHATESQFYSITTPAGAVHQPPPGRAWSVTQTRYEELLSEGKLYFGRDGRGKPNTIKYASEDQGLVPWTWWPHDEVGHNDESKKEILQLFPDSPPFDTPKPERLMKRIIEIGSNPGELVLDCFFGSGTTGAVAHKMGRRWIGVESRHENLDTYAIPRLSKIVHNEDPGGITHDVEWVGGGGFRILDVAPSMFEADGGIVVLADWATNGKLAEATAAQLGFEFESDPPFTGRKGRTRLAVIDGLVSTDVVELIAGALGENERAMVCGTATDPAAGKILRRIRAGSSVRKIPSSILEEYRHARWTPRVANESASGRVANEQNTAAGAA